MFRISGKSRPFSGKPCKLPFAMTWDKKSMTHAYHSIWGNHPVIIKNLSGIKRVNFSKKST